MATANPIGSAPPVNHIRTKTRHGHAGSRTYRVWQAIKQRCLNPRCKEYRHYGGRGITICDRWRDSFVAFHRDMGEPPSPKHEVDRIDNDKGYEPENCRWSTRPEQMRNTRRARPLTFKGRTMVLTDWAKELGISDGALRVRIRQCGTEKALSTPGPRGRMNSPFRETNCRMIEFNGETKTLTEWAASLGIEVRTFHRRLESWGIERAIKTPLLRQGKGSRFPSC